MAPLPTASASATVTAVASRITLAPRFDIGGVWKTVTGGVGTAVGAVSDGVDQAKDGVDAIKALKTTAEEVENFKKSVDALFALWTQYKPLAYAAGAGLLFVVILCQIACCIQWLQNCCCCVMFGIRLSNASCRFCCCLQHCCVSTAERIGPMCVKTSRFVPGITHAIGNAHKLRKDYDGFDPTWLYRAATGHSIPEDLKAVAHFKWFGPTSSWFGRWVAPLWNGHKSRVVRDWAAERGAALKAEKKILKRKGAQAGDVVEKYWDEHGRHFVKVTKADVKEKMKSYSWLDEWWDRMWHGVKTRADKFGDALPANVQAKLEAGYARCKEEGMPRMEEIKNKVVGQIFKHAAETNGEPLPEYEEKERKKR